MTLRIGRAIFVALLALAIATLPASVGFAARAAMATDEAVTQAMPDCVHYQHNAPSGTTQKKAHDGSCLAACAVACFGFAAATNVTGIAYSALETAALKPVRARIDLSSLMGAPPFRPPRA